MLTLIGSTAARRWFDDFRKPNDVDWHTDEPGYHPVSGDVFYDPRLGQWDWGDVATPEELYTMKISHSFWEIHGPRNWDKHASDIIFFQRKGIEFNRDLYDIVLPIWKDIHKKNPTNLNQNKDNFFKDAVKRKYDHDSLHRSVAYTTGEPLYEKFLKDGSDVMTDWSKFMALGHEDALRAVREEIYATALERIMIPNNYKGSPSAAYWWALRRTATSLFKNEWALFLMLNLDELARPDVKYVDIHLENKDQLILLEN